MRRVSKTLLAVVATIALAAVLTAPAAAGTNHQSTATQATAHKARAQKAKKQRKAFFFLDFKTPSTERHAPTLKTVSARSPYVILRPNS